MKLQNTIISKTNGRVKQNWRYVHVLRRGRNCKRYVYVVHTASESLNRTLNDRIRTGPNGGRCAAIDVKWSSFSRDIKYSLKFLFKELPPCLLCRLLSFSFNLFYVCYACVILRSSPLL